MSKGKVLILNLYSPFHYGGIETHVYFMIRNFLKNGFEVHLITEPASKTKKKLRDLSDINLADSRFHHHYLPIKLSNLKMDPSQHLKLVEEVWMKTLKNFISRMNGETFDIIITNMYIEALVVFKLYDKVKSNTPIIVSYIHDTVWDIPRRYRSEIKKYEQRLYKILKEGQKNIILGVLSHYLYHYTVKQSNITKDYLKILKPCIDYEYIRKKANFRNNIEYRLSLLESRNVTIINPARLIPRKMHIVSLILSRKLNKIGVRNIIYLTPWKFPEGEHLAYDLDIVQVYMAKLNQLITSSGLPVRKQVLDYTSLLDILSTSHFMLLPSLCEPFGYSVIESYLVDTPVIVSNSGALPELCWHTKTGFIIGVEYPETKRILSIVSKDELIHILNELWKSKNLKQSIEYLIDFLEYIFENPNEYRRLVKSINAYRRDILNYGIDIFDIIKSRA